MNIALLLHLYQPPQQNAFVINEIAKTCYLPLFKLIKNKRDVKVTLNVPLSLLEWFDKEKCDIVLSELKGLVSSGKVELVGSGAYHPILTKMPNPEIERQVILNESGLGYYLGRTSGFEGESSLLIKDVKGFFPPELAISNRVVSVLDELLYEWVAVDEVAVLKEVVGDRNHVYRASKTKVSLAVRDRALSLCLAYKRDANAKEFLDGARHYADQGRKFVFLALDGETFGHHNQDGVELLSNIFDDCQSLGYKFNTYSELIKEYSSKKECDVVESSWGASDESVKEGNIYPRWYLEGNSFHDAFAKFEAFLLEYEALLPKDDLKITPESAKNLPIWNFNLLSNNQELSSEVKDLIKFRISLDKALNSDKYWWSSKNPYYDVNMIKRSLELFMKVVDRVPKEKDALIKECKSLRDVILSAVKSS